MLRELAPSLSLAYARPTPAEPSSRIIISSKTIWTRLTLRSALSFFLLGTLDVPVSAVGA